MKLQILASAYKAVALAQSKEASRYYLCGVFIEDNSLTATNNHILLKYDTPTGLEAAKHEPFIMAVDTTEKGFKEDPRHKGNLTMFVDVETLIIEFWYVDDDGETCGKRQGVCGFEIIDGTFPDYKMVIPYHTQSEALGHIAFDSSCIATFQKADKILGGNGVLGFTFGSSASEAAIVHLGKGSDTPIVGVQMPNKSKWD